MIFIDACFRKQTPYTPIWMMRQAGRYLTEYKEVRAQAGDFISLCKNPELACEVTLQPVDILDVDAAILFSDILVVPMEMGLPLRFVAGEGPVFDKTVRTESDLSQLQENAEERLEYVYDAISMIRGKLDQEKALIGFCGAPWTLATYMIEGQGSKTYAESKKMVYSNPKLMHGILSMVTEALKGYLERQIAAGVNAVMVFDSWAAALEESAYFEFGWHYMKEIAQHIKNIHPEIPVMLFPKGIGGFLHKIDGDFDVFGVDWSTPMSLAKEKLGQNYVLQGNLEPCRLYNREAMEKGVDQIVKVMGTEGGHIFNLGHGMLPDLPRENAIDLVKMVKKKTKRK